MDKDLVNYLQKKIDRIDDLEKEKSESFIKWIRHIITIFVGLLSILILFNKNKTETCIDKIIYSSILVGIALGVISGIFFLYHQVDNYKKEIQFQKDSLTKRFRGDFDSIYIGDIKTKQIFKISEYIFYISSILTLILLVIYGIMQ